MKDAKQTAQKATQQAAHLHAHKRGDAQHLHYRESHQAGILLAALLLTFLFAGIEAFAGFWANSLALISDAGHMVTDASALALALLAQIIAKRPPSIKNSFGFGRAESLAAFVNCLAMMALIIWIALEAISRFNDPHQVQGQAVMVVAVIGLVINLIVAWILSKDKKSVNTKAALVHVMGDLLGSLAALIAGVVIHFTGWMQIDPILSLIRSTINVLKESYHFLMEGVPHHIDYVQVGKDLKAVEGVLAVHDLHVWEMSPGHPALIGHVEVRDLQDWPITMEKINKMLLEKHEIDHVTLQPEMPS
jgi:cobalt-zinc-cadmium efflux system protein